MRTGYVYLIGADTGPIKIGHAVNVKARLSSLQTGNWEPLSILHSVTVPWTVAPAIEGLVHGQFEERRVRGEWFAVPLEVLKPSLDSVALQYSLERQKGDWFSERVCFALCDDPRAAFQAVGQYRDTANKPGMQGYINSINTALLASVGQAAYVMFQVVIVQGRDIGLAVRNNSRLARQAETSMVQSLNALAVIWKKAEAKRNGYLDFSRKRAA